MAFFASSSLGSPAEAPSLRSPAASQQRVLRRLLHQARHTEFGRHYGFAELLRHADPTRAFQQRVPLHDYNALYNQWWHKTRQGLPDVCWPGKAPYFALSSGTSEAASKYIPVTTDLLRGNQAVMLRQLLSLRHYVGVPWSCLLRGWLSLGGSTALAKQHGYYAGDLSGITAREQPFWFRPFYKPGARIARERDWQRKLTQIVEKAPDWDISFLLGVPAWVQLCLEMIIERYQLTTIHDLWPNLRFFVHGGVAFEPYQKSFARCLARPLTYLNTYLASEGFLAYQHEQNASSMRLVVDEHLFFEFVEFTDQHFDADGNLRPTAEARLLPEVREGVDYALLLSTAGGAWRYLLGDTIRFTNTANCELIITGRTKFFLSLVGEHLSVDNMNAAIQRAQARFDIRIPEFTVAGVPHGSHFAHHWYVATPDAVDAPALRHYLDAQLRELNDDYAVERRHTLAAVHLDVLPPQRFLDFMQRKGKLGGQHKFPRVLKGELLAEWQQFVAEA